MSMSKYMVTFLSLVVVCALSACGGSESPSSATDDTVEAKAVSPVAGETAAKIAVPEESAPAALDTKAIKAAAPEKPVRPNATAANQAARMVLAKAAEPAIETSGTPKIECAEAVFDFGEQDNEQPVKHDFIIKNTGDGTLVIKKVKTSCGCTAAAPEDKTVEPGEETKIATTLKLKGRQGPTAKSVTVETNDPTTPAYKLQLKGTAIASIMIEPRMISFGRIVADSPRTSKATIKTMKKDFTFHITEVDTSSSPNIQAEVKTLEEGKAYEVAVTLLEPLATGNLNGRLTVKTDAPTHPSIPLTVYAQVLGVLDVAPPKITVQVTGDPTNMINMSLRVRPGQVSDFEVTEVVAPIPDMGAELDQRAQNDYLIKLTNIPAVEEMNGKELIIKTNLPEHPELKVPIVTIKRNARRMPQRPANVTRKDVNALRRPATAPLRMKRPVRPNAPVKPKPAVTPAPGSTKK